MAPPIFRTRREDNGRLGISRRGLILGALGLTITSCGRNQLGRNAATAFRFATTGIPGPEIKRETVNNIPYASIAARLGKGPRSLLVLWRTTRRDHHWLSADNAALVTQNGRIIRTAGLPTNLAHTQHVTEDPLSSGWRGGPARSYLRALDFPEQQLYGVEVESTFELIGEDTITITEIEFDTIVISERCKSRSLNWSFTNRYWLDPADGFVWRSEQMVTPDLPKFVIEVLKPPVADT